MKSKIDDLFRMMLPKKLDGNCLFDSILKEMNIDCLFNRVHGDVFRPPQRKNVLAALVGSGIQLFLMSFIVIGSFVLQARK